MESWEDNEVRIERYLEGKMSLEEEKFFMQELNANEELRKQYEDELLISALLNNETEATDEIKTTVTKSNTNNNNAAKNKEKKAPDFSFIRKYALAIAAIAIIVIATVIFGAIKTQHPAQQTTLQTGTNRKQPSVTSVDTLNSQPSSTSQTALHATALYKKFYTLYTAKNNPVEISAFYDDYKRGDYKKVLSASAADYQVMGAGANQQRLSSYMYLYKGLCYLETNDPQNAIFQFNSLRKITANEHLRNNADWYKALSYVKLNKTDSATKLLSAILQTQSSYHKQAKQLLTELEQTK